MLAVQVEYGMAVRCVALPNFIEGVRAAVVDKDRCPKWVPKRLEDIQDADVGQLFAPLPEAVRLRCPETP